MPKLPVVSGVELVKVLVKELGFRILRREGSHITLAKNGVRVTVPLHREIDRGLLNGILKHVGMSREEFLKRL